MCGYEQWERFARRFQEAVDEDRVREFVADAISRVETLIEEYKVRACAPEGRDSARPRCGRSRPEWVA
jgi:hypothetical protein